MILAQIENNLNQLVENFNKQTFIYELLLAYNHPKASITRLQKGGLNLSKIPGEIDWKKKLFFKEVTHEDLHDVIDNAVTNERIIKHDPRFIVVTDFETLLAVDRKTKDTLDIPILEIAKHPDFFLPWAGIEKRQLPTENPADVKAAAKMAKLYDEIRKENPATSPDDIHSLNVFLSRLLFCFFAEDTGIFEKNLFTNSISSHTSQDGSDLHTYLNTLFEIMNTNTSQRNNPPAYLDAFPFVNGGLFRNNHPSPKFSMKSRQLLIECGSLQWRDIHPDIFGSMIQAVVSPEHRGGFGMHYTSVPNIMKVIEPLFLNELKEEFEAAKFEPRRLLKLLERLSKIKIFDPACGSGNFLIIAYKELRLLEIEILQQLQSLQKAATGFEPKQLELIPKAQLTLAAAYQPTLFSRIELSQFYGIELDDFAHEIAILSLWLAQHQMNVKFKEAFNTCNPTLPLQASGNIIHGNATRLNWEVVCSKEADNYIYILGNPPYLGAKELDKQQKGDMDLVFAELGNVKRLDYISCWFKIASDYIFGSEAKYAFVSTNSICQGEQVPLIWPYILLKKEEIFFCHQPFDWENNAKSNAGVTCVIVGVQNIKKDCGKIIYYGAISKQVKNISPYLIEANSIIVHQRVNSLSGFPKMILGSSGFDGGNLLLTVNERLSLINSNPEAEVYIKRFMSGNDFLYDDIRYCLWIDDDQLEEALKIPYIKVRIEKCKEFRLKAGRDARKAADVPHRFFYQTHRDSDGIIFPKTTSGKREYVPTDFVKANTIYSNAVFLIYDADPYIFAILSSRMHKVWMEVTSAKMRSDFRYSVNLTYNTFPFLPITHNQKQELERHVFTIISERENLSEKTLAELYDPKNMPISLRDAHQELDFAIDRCYRSKPFTSDEERLEYLFRLYAQMIEEEKQKNGEIIFEQQNTKKKIRNKYA
ncbi:class I SAM-dependent DNA methyltransferase [Ilyomonas limi]|uniref:site-specific DNA-methyltransferase (adenine-specific) n=1 Tax=Ilyomonas limi TaxID=2575867 RepID=A0A4U3KSR3_9BACT|nr:DNA methyltransferase [Ilyomonas limi]TKK65418.1 class I SAM-dependent DNA methyltransferase [Ilyomonas limi]